MAVDGKQRRKPLVVVSTKLPAERRALLDWVCERRGDEFVSATVRHAIDRLIAEHQRAALEEAA